MSEQVIYNKRKLCFTEVSDFTDFQGVGSAPMYQRYDSVQAVLRTCIEEKYWSFLAEPLYNAAEDTIEWYVEKWNEHPRRMVDLSGEARTHYQQLMDEALQHYRQALATLENEDWLIMGGVLKYVSEDMVFCYDDKVVLIGWGMKYDSNKHNDFGSLIRAYEPPAPHICQVSFKAGDGGTIPGDGVITVQEGTTLTAEMIPPVTPNEEYSFVGWNRNPIGEEITGDCEFVAQYEKKVIHPKEEPAPPEEQKTPSYNVQFNDGGNGILRGVAQYRLAAGTPIAASMIPSVEPKRGYKFTGWDVDPLTCNVDGDKVFTAHYEKKKSLWARIWPWLWKILLLLLLLLLLFFLLRNCKGCNRSHKVDGVDTVKQVTVPPGQVHPQDPPFNGDDSTWMALDPNTGKGGIFNPGDPYTPAPTPPEYRDILPPDQGVLPPIRDDDPIRRNPGEPVIRENLLLVWMQNEDKSIMELGRDFKNAYPGEDYKITSYSEGAKCMEIEVPIAQREYLKGHLKTQFAPKYKLEVFDVSMFGYELKPSDPAMSNNNYTWYLKAIHAFEAWDITMGSDQVVVAVVDNGFTLNHKELYSKVVQPYNVWTHDDKIFAQSEDHGTHVAGTAIGSANNGVGLCGIAPNCKFMPVQVADQQGRMTTTSILYGILYALYQGADVVNVSLGAQMTGLSDYPEEFQRQLIQKNKEEERLWQEVSRIADLHKATLVVAAGNDNVLAGIDALHRPENIIVVSALDKQNRNFDKAAFSNYGTDYTTISAPGVDIYSCYHNGFQVMQGTSMAAPVVSGAVALMKSLNKDLTTQQIICVLQSSGMQVSGKVGPMLMLDKALQKVKNNETDDCELSTPQPAHGDVEISLKWGNYNDLDLYCTDPAGETVYYDHQTSRSGGTYQFDMNASNRTTTPLEHIYWPTGGAPTGNYSVSVYFCRRKDENHDATPYVLTMKYNGNVEVKQGTVSTSDRKSETFTFTLNGAGNSGSGNR